MVQCLEFIIHHCLAGTLREWSSLALSPCSH